MHSRSKGFMHEETAEDLIEYGLLAAFVAAVAIACIIGDPLGLRPAVEGAYQDCIDALNSI